MSLEGKVLATIPLVAFDFADLNLPAPHLPQVAPGRPLRLLLAGRLKRYKGLQLLADALQMVGTTPPLSVRVVGAVQDKSEIAALAALPGVDLDLGWKSDRELIAHLDWADVTVLPYMEASQSGVAPMSLKRGRPVIATPVGGLPEQIRHGETGLLTESVSPQAIAAAIKRLAEDRDFLHRLAANARRHAEEDIGWRTLGPRFSDVLERVAR